MKEIQLTQGYVALVDNKDFKYLNQFRWHASINGKNVYAERSVTIDSKTKHKLMHREVMKAEKKMEIDHIFGNGLDNRRKNLRICTHSQNLLNSSKYKNSSSKYKGVYWGKKQNKWIAQVNVEGKNKHLGGFDNEIDAAKQYNIFAKEYYGEFARLNVFIASF